MVSTGPRQRIGYTANCGRRLGSETAIVFRLYLSITSPEQRKALAGLLLADPHLAEAQLRYMDGRGRREKTPYEWRLCRFCMTDVEDTLHALFAYSGSPELRATRAMFWIKCGSSSEPIGAIRFRAPKDILQYMLASKRLVPILAEYLFDVLRVFEKTDMFLASEAY